MPGAVASDRGALDSASGGPPTSLGDPLLEAAAGEPAASPPDPPADAPVHDATHPAGRTVPPDGEVSLGLGTYLTHEPGIGGRLRTQAEDFVVIELGPGPRHAPEGRFAGARIRLRNWETNRFVDQAARRIGLQRNAVGFAGMKDKRAVTEQWFTFECESDRLRALDGLDDVEVLEVRQTASRQFAGAHEGNRFVLRIRDHRGDPATVRAIADRIATEGGVPHFFGPQRFGGGVRPVTHLMGRAIVEGDLEEAVRLYVGHPMAGEREDTRLAREVYESSRDAEAALALMPPQLDHERAILQRLMRRPGDWANALRAMPPNLLTLFVHAWQSYVFNHVLTARLEAGLGLRTAHVGDRVIGIDDDGTRTHLVTPANQARVQDEIDRGRAAPTAILPGLSAPLAEGAPGEVERTVLRQLGIAARDFRCHAMPRLASDGRRRTILQPAHDLSVEWRHGDPVIGFSLGKGSYATVVMREFMKSGLGAY